MHVFFLFLKGNKKKSKEMGDESEREKRQHYKVINMIDIMGEKEKSENLSVYTVFYGL